MKGLSRTFWLDPATGLAVEPPQILPLIPRICGYYTGWHGVSRPEPPDKHRREEFEIAARL